MRRVARGWCLWREGVVNETVGLERGALKGADWLDLVLDTITGGTCTSAEP